MVIIDNKPWPLLSLIGTTITIIGGTIGFILSHPKNIKWIVLGAAAALFILLIFYYANALFCSKGLLTENKQLQEKLDDNKEELRAYHDLLGQASLKLLTSNITANVKESTDANPEQIKNDSNEAILTQNTLKIKKQPEIWNLSEKYARRFNDDSIQPK